jgi:ABC-type Fe3+ transport system substrate-binding protein
VPYQIDFATPIFGTADDLAINRNTPHPYASALFADWSLSQESQEFVASQGRGPVTIKHPFLPDTIDLVDNVDPPPDVMQRLIFYWKKYMEKKG